MMRERNSNFYLPIIMAVILGVLCGCEEREIPVVSDEEQIIQYLTYTEEGQELFRTHDLIPDDPYVLPYDSSVYQDVVDSTWRDIDVFIDSTRTYDFGALGQHYIAVATVTDRFFVTTVRILGDDTTHVFDEGQERLVQRYGYFVKLGDDSKPYLGWLLRGFNSLGSSGAPVNLSVITADGTQTLAATLAQYNYNSPGSSLPFIHINDINDLNSGDTLIFNVSPWTGQTVTYYHLTTGATRSGFITQAMDRVDDQHWVDTIVTPSPNPRLYNIVFVQSFLTPPSFQYMRGWCIPYRTP
jgi:hypothetical protein